MFRGQYKVGTKAIQIVSRQGLTLKRASEVKINRAAASANHAAAAMPLSALDPSDPMALLAAAQVTRVF